MVTHNYPRYDGDRAGAFIARLAEALAADAGCEVAVLAPHAEGAPTSERVRGVEVHRFRYAPDRLEVVAYRGDLHRAVGLPSVALALPGFLGAFRWTAGSLARRWRADVIHAHWWFPGGWAAGSGEGVPRVLTCHGTDVRLLERRALRPLARRVFQAARAVTTVSDHLARDIVGLLPGSGPAPVTLRMPVDITRFEGALATPKAGPPRVLYAGNLLRTKGVDVLLRAFADVRRRGIEARLRLVGDGPEGPALRELTSDLGISGDVEWSPFVPHHEMPGEFGAATVAVLPSRGSSEGLGLVLVEALLAGCAVVGSSSGGIPEVVSHDETGLLVPEGDHLSLATALQRLLTEPALRQRLTDQGRRIVRRAFSPRTAAERFHAVYEGVTDGASGR